MKFCDYALPSAIIVDLKSTTKEGVIREMARALQRGGAFSEDSFDRVVAGYLRREELGSTGFCGIAFPTFRTDAVKGLAVAIGVSRQGVDFECCDLNPAHVIVMFISTPESFCEYCRLIDLAGRIFKDENVVKELREARDASEVLAILRRADEQIGERAAK